MSSLSPRGRMPGRSPFDAIRHAEENSDGSEFEYWEAREAMGHLGYSDWRNIENVIRKARTACRKSGSDPGDHFVDVNKMVTLGSGAERSVPDVQMTRFGMYLLAMNGDPEKSGIAMAKVYFAVQTRRAEVELPPVAQTQPTLLPYTIRVLEAAAVEPNVPDEHWCIFIESSHVLIQAEQVLVPAGLKLDVEDLLDGSIGQRWSAFRNGKAWAVKRSQFAYRFPPPSKRSCIVVRPHAYHDTELTHFRRWLKHVYLPIHFSDYLQRKYGLGGFRAALPHIRRVMPAALAGHSSSA